jgi:hypothetical protein
MGKLLEGGGCTHHRRRIFCGYESALLANVRQFWRSYGQIKDSCLSHQENPLQYHPAVSLKLARDREHQSLFLGAMPAGGGGGGGGGGARQHDMSGRKCQRGVQPLPDGV